LRPVLTWEPVEPSGPALQSAARALGHWALPVEFGPIRTRFVPAYWWGTAPAAARA